MGQEGHSGHSWGIRLRPFRACAFMDGIGLDWIGLDRLDWIGLDWVGLDWID